MRNSKMMEHSNTVLNDGQQVEIVTEVALDIEYRISRAYR